MSWKDLDIKLKAELIKLGVQSGIRDIKLIRLLYDDNNIPTLVVELSYNETNVKPLLGIERIKLEYGIPEEEINKANAIIQLIEKEISLEEINNQLPVLFRLFNRGGYKDGNDKTKNKENKTYGPYELPAVIITPDSQYNEFINSLPDNHKYTPEEEYRMYKYWQLWGKPKNFLYTLNNPNEDGDYMFNWDTSDSSYHGSTIAWGDDGVGYFIKPKHHETLKYEFDYFNKGIITEEGGVQRSMTPEEQKEWEEFKSKYTLKEDGNFYKYVPKAKEGYLSNNPTLSYSGGGPIKRKRENSLDWRMAVYNAVDPRTTVKNIDDAFRLYNAAVAKEKRGEDFKDYTLNNNIGDLTSDAAWRKRLLLPYDETLLPVWNGDTVSLSRPLELEIPVDTNLVKDRINYAKDEFWNDVKSLNLRQLKEDLSYKKSQEELLDALRYTYKTGKPIGVSEYHANSIDPEKVLKDFKYGISPLNVLGRYNIRYDKDENKMYYSDEWDFNLYEWAVPGTTFRIRGAIPLNNKNEGKVKKYSKGGYENYDEPPVSESTHVLQLPLNILELELLNYLLSKPTAEQEYFRNLAVLNMTAPQSNLGVILTKEEQDLVDKAFLEYNNFRYSHPWAEGLNYTPIIGDGMDLISLAGDINNKDYINAGLGLGMLVLPNFILKPGLKAIKKFIPKTIDNHEIKYIPTGSKINKNTYIDFYDAEKLLKEKQALDFKMSENNKLLDLLDEFSQKHAVAKIVRNSDGNMEDVILTYPKADRSTINSNRRTNKQVRDIIARHNTFARGVQMPTDLEDIEHIRKIFGDDWMNKKDEVLKYVATHVRPNYEGFFIAPTENAGMYGNDSRGSLNLVRRKYKLGKDRNKWFEEGDFTLLQHPTFSGISWDDVTDIVAPWINPANKRTRGIPYRETELISPKDMYWVKTVKGDLNYNLPTSFNTNFDWNRYKNGGFIFPNLAFSHKFEK